MSTGARDAILYVVLVLLVVAGLALMIVAAEARQEKAEAAMKIVIEDCMNDGNKLYECVAMLQEK